MPAPSFINSKHDRNSTDYELDVENLIGRYEDIFKGLLRFEGNLPEDMPEGYIMRCLFRSGSVQIKNTTMGLAVIPVKPVTWTLYGAPKTAVPAESLPYEKGSLEDLFKPSDEPVLFIGDSMRDKIMPYVRMMASALKTLRQNLIVLRQPIVLQGIQGGELNQCIMGKAIEDGDSMLYTLKGVAVPAQTLDLGGKDYTQNLIGVINAMDSQCLTLMGVKGSGADKASGISAVETEYVAQQTGMLVYTLLNLAQQWCERVNSRHPDMQLSVTLGEGWTPTASDDPGTEEAVQENTDDEQ